ncbi:MAG: chloride channel protein [Pseudomonadota bacterium]
MTDDSTSTDPPSTPRGQASMRSALSELLGWHHARTLWRLFLLCALVGVVAGLGAAVFFYLLEGSSRLFLDGIAGYRPQHPGGETPLFLHSESPFNRWWLFALPALGGLVSGWLVYTFAPEAEGHGTDAAIDAYHHKAGFIRSRVPLVKTIASAITIGTGGSAGREGPIAQIGAGFGSMLGRWLDLDPHEKRIMMAAGMGAGVGAIFHAPLAGALFSAEVLYREMDLEYEVITPSILASIVAYSVFSLIFGWEPLFHTPAFVFHNPAELLPYTVLALAVSAGGALFVMIFYRVNRLFAGLRLPRMYRPALGGLVVGVIGLAVPEALASGYGVVQGAILDQAAIGLLLAVALAKILTTSFTIGSGGSGGVFGPSVVIGGALGGGVGLWLHSMMPQLVANPGSYAMVGMAGFFTAVANTPISTVIMVSEMTGNYHLLVPSMWVCTIAFLLVRRTSIYDKQVATRADAPHHLREMTRALLERLRVGDVLQRRQHTCPPAVAHRTPLHSVLHLFADSDCQCLPVVDDTGRLTGTVHLDAVQKTLGDESTLDPLLIAEDLAEPAVTVTADESLQQALHRLTASGHQSLLVVDPRAPEQVLDILSTQDISEAYDALVQQTLQPGMLPFARSVFTRALQGRPPGDDSTPRH